ncbi:hypothetical protein F975_01299 [Acinetobacter sp. ANC 3789]|uniref:hypothetical protein n=1 Tax=Acinetobacter sp. ANC 3789 TaxID=1217714 RepID=UPI0002D0772A|nr:hypothetical protein [Acinetobacter sp. ANC 3789]ENU80752.1 hypothetical protein F975_01299 [Acinetobacter sp. ANC 3789]
MKAVGFLCKNNKKSKASLKINAGLTLYHSWQALMKDRTLLGLIFKIDLAVFESSLHQGF